MGFERVSAFVVCLIIAEPFAMYAIGLKISVCPLARSTPQLTPRAPCSEQKL